MLFSTFVLISVEREHDRLQERVDLGEGDKTAEGGDVAGLRLEEEEEVGVLLQLAVVGVVAFLLVDFFEVSFNFVLLPARSNTNDGGGRGTHFVKSHAILDEERDTRVEVAHVALEHKVLLALRRYPRLELAKTFLR